MKAENLLVSMGVQMIKKKRTEAQLLKKEENELEERLAEPGWKNVLTPDLKSKFQAAARNQLQKTRKEARVNLRVNEADVERFRELAEQEGIGYQTLMTSILHKYAQGVLVDRALIEELKKAVISMKG